MNTFTKSIAITALASVVSLVYAESAVTAARGPVPFNAIDLDGNGSISARGIQHGPSATDVRSCSRRKTHAWHGEPSSIC